MGGRVAIELQVIMDVEDGPSLGYYAKGHHDPAEFFAACEREYDHDAEEAGISYVRHVWWRNVPIRDHYSPCSYRFVPAGPGERGAYRATILDIDEARLDRALPGIVAHNEKALTMHATVCPACARGRCQYAESREATLRMYRDRLAALTPAAP